jgi:hypothetical protein
MLKKLSLLAVLALLCQFSYSRSITPYYGQTGNAAADALRWNMGDVLPSSPGLDINAVIYRYTIHKATEDSVTVNVQNEHASGNGYIFRETDEWKPGSLDGTSINKAVPVIPTNRELWGDGSIDVVGPGTVSEPLVVYNYRIDPCYDPQFDPNCPGYKVPIPDIAEVDLSSVYDGTEYANREQADSELYDEEENKDEDKEEKEKEEKKDRAERLEKALAAADTSAMFANSFAQAQMLAAINQSIGMQAQYSQVTIPGGEYRETTSLDGGNIPDNAAGRRLNLASDKKHKDMVDMQY